MTWNLGNVVKQSFMIKIVMNQFFFDKNTCDTSQTGSNNKKKQAVQVQLRSLGRKMDWNWNTAPKTDGKLEEEAHKHGKHQVKNFPKHKKRHKLSEYQAPEKFFHELLP